MKSCGAMRSMKQEDPSQECCSKVPRLPAGRSSGGPQWTGRSSRRALWYCVRAGAAGKRRTEGVVRQGREAGLQEALRRLSLPGAPPRRFKRSTARNRLDTLRAALLLREFAFDFVHSLRPCSPG